MSTRNGVPQEWIDADYDAHGYERGESKRTGHFSWHHTSDTVAWVVNGKSAYTMSPAEFEGLCKACADWSKE